MLNDVKLTAFRMGDKFTIDEVVSFGIGANLPAAQQRTLRCEGSALIS